MRRSLQAGSAQEASLLKMVVPFGPMTHENADLVKEMQLAKLRTIHVKCEYRDTVAFVE